jgi:hypothetical protein
MVLQVAGMILLLATFRFRLVPSILFLLLSGVFLYVNATYTNCGSIPEHLIGVPIFWVIFCALFIKARVHHHEAV